MPFGYTGLSETSVGRLFSERADARMLLPEG